MDDQRIGPSHYDSRYFDSALDDFGSRFQRYRVRHVRRLLDPRPGERVLDLGCGWGTMSLALAPLVAEVVGVDFSPAAIERCEARRREAGVANASFLQAPAESTGLEAASFDAAVAADLFEHLYPEQSSAAAEEAFRLLRPGGRFAVWTPCRSHAFEILKNDVFPSRRDPTHVDYKSMPTLRRLLTDAGFDIRRAGYEPSHWPGLSVLERAAGPWLPLLRRRIAVLAEKPVDEHGA